MQKNRRGFLGFVSALLMTMLGLCLAVPALAYLAGPLRRKQGKGATGDSFRDVGALKEFPLGEWRLVNLEVVRANGWEKSRTRHSVWVCRQEEGDQAITVLSPICPHLGCPVNWHQAQAHFMCPCHGGIFEPTGQLLSGPPPRNLDSLEYEVRADRLWVRWQDFKVGVHERVPVAM